MDHASQNKKHVANPISYATFRYLILNDITRLSVGYLLGITLNSILKKVISYDMSYL